MAYSHGRNSCGRLARLLLILLAVFIHPFLSSQAPAGPAITICWDASASMAGNQPVHALRYLDAVFAEQVDCRIRLLVLRNEIEESQHQVVGGNWNALRNKLENLHYDGAFFYSQLNARLTESPTYIYTDGQNLYKSDRLVLAKGNTVLSRATGSARESLERATLLYRGNYVQLKPMDPETVRGNSVASLPATESDIEVPDGVIALDQVEVRQEKPVEAITVQTATGERDRDRVGVDIKNVGDDEISEIQTDISQTLQGRVSGLRVGAGQDATQFTTRTNFSMLGDNYGLIVVDGTPIAKSNSSIGAASLQSASFIDPANIADITVLKGLNATNRYGEQGRNGVLLITTKNAVYGSASSSGEDALRLKNNIYSEESNEGETASQLIRVLAGMQPEAAYEYYLANRPTADDIPGYYIDAYAHFRQSRPALASRIISNLAERFPNQPEYLRTVLMGLLETGDNANAWNIAQMGLDVKPDDVRFLFEAASNQDDARLRKQAVTELVRRHRSNVPSAPVDTEFQAYLQKEVQRLLRKDPGLASQSAWASDYGTGPMYKARLVFEWNRPGADFTIQSVNPQSRYYNWEHSPLTSPDLIRSEVESGFAVKAFDLYGERAPGQWIFNVEIPEDGTPPKDLPLVVGCRIYRNFGTPSETSEYRTVQLSAAGQKQTMITFTVE